MAKRILGIRIVAEPQFDSGGVSAQVFRTFIGEFKKGELFATNPAIREILEKGKLPIGMEIGWVEIAISHTDKQITTARFRPLGADYGLARVALEGKGIATFIENQIERFLLKRFPDYSIRSTAPASVLREAQLRRRGREPGVPIPLKEAVRLSSQQVREGMRRYWQKQRARK